MSTYHNYLAVVGRVCGDDEDDIVFYENMTSAQAKAAFREDLYAGGNEIFVNYVLTSTAPIELLERNI